MSIMEQGHFIARMTRLPPHRGEISTSTGNTYGIGFDASRSDSTYGKSDTVQPPALTLLPCIEAYDAAVDSGLIDITELTNEVAGKADTNLSNLSATGKAKVASLAMPSNQSVPLTASTNPTVYTAGIAGIDTFMSWLLQTRWEDISIWEMTLRGLGCMVPTGANGAAKAWIPARKGECRLYGMAKFVGTYNRKFHLCRRESAMKYGIVENHKFILIDEDRQRLENPIPFMPKLKETDIAPYEDREIERGADGAWYEKGHAPQRPLEEVRNGKTGRTGNCLYKGITGSALHFVCRVRDRCR